MNALLDGPVAQAISAALLHSLWEGVLIAGILGAVLALVNRRSSSLRYAVSCAALALLFGAFVATAVRSWAPVEAPARDAGTAAVPFIPADQDVATPPAELSSFVPLLQSLVRSQTTGIVMVWMTGVLLLFIRLGAGWVRARRTLLRGGESVPAHCQRVASRLADALGVTEGVRVISTMMVEVPSVMGWLRPVVLLPVSCLTGLSPEQLEMVLAHELAHVRRRDFLVNALQSIVEAVLFYNPATWWISRQIRRERENCCDDLAVSVCGNAMQYARALAQLEELRGAPSPALAITGGSLLPRVRRILGQPEQRHLGTGLTALLAAASLATVLAVLSTPMMAAARGTEPDQDAPKTPTVEVEGHSGLRPGLPALAPPAKVPATPRAAPAPDPDFDYDFDLPDIADAVAAVPVVAPAAPVAIAAAVPAVAPVPPVAPVLAPEAWGGFADDDDASGEESGQLSVNDLVNLRVHGVTPEFVDQMRSAFGTEVSLRRIAGLKAMDVTPDYVRQMRAAFGSDLSPRDVLMLKSQDIDAQFVASVRSTFGSNTSAREVVSLKAMDLKPEYVQAMRGVFGNSLSAREAVSLNAMKVTADWVKEMRAAGVEIKSAREATMLRAMSVNAAMVKALAEAGYAHLSAHDVARLAGSGVNADFIREMSKYRSKQK